MIKVKDNKKILDLYDEVFKLLDEYDHQSLTKPKGNKSIDKLGYVEAKEFIEQMRFNGGSDVFGIEKETGKLEGILVSIEQSVFGVDAYESFEEKAANLLYFLVKDHPFADGCKRIAAGLFLLYLYKNNYISDTRISISCGVVSALTILVAESKPEEKDIIIKLIMNILCNKL